MKKMKIEPLQES